MLLRHPLSFIALSLLAACGPSHGDLDAGPPALELGTGEASFAPLEDGETLDLVRGCQGSQHVWVALRARGIERRGPVVDLSLTRDSDDWTVSQTFTVRVTFDESSEAPYVERHGLTLVVPEPDLALGEDLTLHATVTDRNGVTISDERPVRIEWGEGGC